MSEPTNKTVILLDRLRPGVIPVTEILGLTGVVKPDTDVDPAVCTALEKLISPGDNDIRVTYYPATIPPDATVISAVDSVSEAIMTMRTALTVGQWEQQQTHHSLLAYLEEEVAEFIEAVTAGEPEQQLCLELGDILLQVLFHAEIAARRGAFDFFDVAAGFVEKLKARAPYLFDGTTGVVPVATQKKLWQLGKLQL